MTFHAFHFSWLMCRHSEFMLMFGVATGRVSYAPAARWLYSFRVFLGIARVEILWRTGPPTAPLGVLHTPDPAL